MYHLVTVHFRGSNGTRFKVLADTPTGALCSVLAFDWTVAQRKNFLGARVDPYQEGDLI